MWEMSSYRDFLSENAGRHNVVGSGVLVAAAVAMMAMLLVLF